jgi:hypothetical protein
VRNNTGTRRFGEKDLVFSGGIGNLSRDDLKDYARITQQLLARPDLKELGRNAWRVAETELSWDILTDRLDSRYHDLLRLNGLERRARCKRKG